VGEKCSGLRFVAKLQRCRHKATRSVVVDDVPPCAVVAGNPARVVKTRFDAATVGCLLAIRWWDWDIGKVTRNIAAIRGADLEALETAR
jgi:virginiamycin A acetyltransferase